MEIKPQPPLALANLEWDDSTEPFDGDVLRRKDVADTLTTYIGRMGVGGVIALDAPWS